MDKFYNSVRFQYRGHAEWWTRATRAIPETEADVRVADYVMPSGWIPLAEFDSPLDLLEHALDAVDTILQPGDMLITSEYDIPGEPSWVWRTHNYIVLTESGHGIFRATQPKRVLRRPDLRFVLQAIDQPFPSFFHRQQS